MRLEDMLKDISGITNNVVKTNCFEGQNTLLDNILLIQTKVNEVIQSINDGIIKGDKGDTPNVQVGNTETLEPNSNASVTQTGDILNPIFNFGIPKGEKGDKGDTGKATESIQDNVISPDTTWSSEKFNSYFNDLKNIQGVKYGNDVGYQVCNGTHNGVVKDLKIYGKTIKGLLESASKSSYTLNTTTRSKMFNLINPIPANTDIYIRVNVTAKKAPIDGLKINVLNDDDTVNYFEGVKGVYEQSLKIKHTKSIKKIGFYLSSAEFANDDTSNITFKESQVTLVDVGTTYIEGLASVGNGNEIEVLSINNGNLFDGEFIKGTVNGVDGNLIPDTNGYMITQKNIIKVFPGISVKYKSTGARGFRPGKNVLYYYYDKSEKIISRGSLNTFDEISIPNGCYGLRLTFADFELNSSFNASNYNMTLNQIGRLDNPNFAKQDKKTILFKDVDNTWKPVTNLRGIDETNCDVVDSVSNKFIKKYGVRSYQVGDETNSNVITDMTNTVYKLDEQLEYEINPIYPESYSNETLISFSSGVIPCKNEFYIDSNLGSLQLETNERLSRIEDYIYQSNVAILRGDFRTLAELYYPNDFIKEEELANE